MPGHKRNTSFFSCRNPYTLDFTEIDDFDNLNNPTGILRDLENEIKFLYGSTESILSVNGSTMAIHVAIRSICRKTKKILIARNAHKSVYSAVELNCLDYEFIIPSYDKNGYFREVRNEDVRDILSKKQFDAVIITSPTYEGYISDLSSIYDICREYNTALIVDAAHGSHFSFSEIFSQKINRYCDVSIMSFHKNLSALTQSAVLHINNSKMDVELFRHNMRLFQTSSPSYLIMYSISQMVDFLKDSRPYFEDFKHNLNELYKIKLKHLKFINDKMKDPSKILISLSNCNIDGFNMKDLLKKRKIEVEMASKSYILLISTVFDRKCGFEKLKNALLEIDASLNYHKDNDEFSFKLPKRIYNLDIALTKKHAYKPLNENDKFISASYIYSYPPGIPIYIPGEILDFQYIKKLIENGVSLTDEKNFISEKVDVIDK